MSSCRATNAKIYSVLQLIQMRKESNGVNSAREWKRTLDGLDFAHEWKRIVKMVSKKRESLYKISISGLARAEACPASRHLPQEDLDLDDPHAARGTRIHNDLEQSSTSMTPTSPEALAVAEAWPDLFYLGRVEVPMALDPKRAIGRFLPKTTHRAYEDVTADEIPGTCDAILHVGDNLSIVDYKSGSTWYGNPAESLQLSAHAIAYSFATNRLLNAGVTLSYVYIREGKAYPESAFVEDLTPAFKRIQEIVSDRPEPMAEPGDHCKYCAARRYCPAYLLGASIPMIAPTLATIPQDKIAHAVIYLENMERAAERLRADIENHVIENGPIQMGSHEFARKVEKRENINPEIAAKIAPGKMRKTVAKSDLSQDELDAIRAAGGVNTTTYSKYYKRKIL